ncbi:isochorismatase family protein [Aquimarina sp. 2304DJ70-9]|uniref:isochorismatase family protein n=1 Tax=Aquimarina penaris TaxID=3231044 RepID=UPI00346338A9
MRTVYLKQLFSIVIVLFLVQATHAQLPEPVFEIDGNTAIVITDPQVDFLSTKGVAWGAVGESVKENNTVANIETLFKLGERYNIPVFVSPHYYYPHDHTWKFEGVLERLMHNIKMFDRTDQVSSEGFEGSGADWMPQYKKYINKSRVTVSGPHKIYGPESNDLALQLRKQKIDKIILGGMSGNLCIEAHMRELMENGFEVAVVGDATASAKLPGLDGNRAAQTNFKMISSKVFTTKELAAELAK